MVMWMNEMRNNDQMRLSMLFVRLSDDMDALQIWSTSVTTRPPASIQYASSSSQLSLSRFLQTPHWNYCQRERRKLLASGRCLAWPQPWPGQCHHFSGASNCQIYLPGTANLLDQSFKCNKLWLFVRDWQQMKMFWLPFKDSLFLSHWQVSELKMVIMIMTMVRRWGADMIFVQNFTLPDFQAKSFTPQKSVICDIFFRKLTA